MNKKELMRVRLVNNAKRLLAVGLVFIILPMISSCSNEDEDEDLIGTWYRMSDFDGLARSDASSFTINNKGYLVGGYDGKERFTDTWEYDMDANNWTQKAPFPGIARNSGVAFTLNGKGYYGTGYDGENNLKDFGNTILLQIAGHRKQTFQALHAMEHSPFLLVTKGM